MLKKYTFIQKHKSKATIYNQFLFKQIKNYRKKHEIRMNSYKIEVL